MKNSMPKKGKKAVLIISVVCVLALIGGISGCLGKTRHANEDVDSTVLTESAPTDTLTDQQNGETAEDALASLVSTFNKTAETELVFVEDFDPQDKESQHYKKEFRLNAYKDALGKSYTYDGIRIDLVAEQPFLDQRPAVRLYADEIELSQCNDIIRGAALFFDPELTVLDIEELITDLANHYDGGSVYKGGLSVTYNSYWKTLMLKYE